MYKRTLTNEIQELAKGYPVITVVGPRQAGKTTLVRNAFPHKPYVSLEDLDVQELAIADPRAFLAGYPQGAILDEIQRAPGLLSYIQGIVLKTSSFFKIFAQKELLRAISFMPAYKSRKSALYN